MKIFFVALVLFSIFIPITRAELSDKFRDNFPDIVRELCHNSNPEMYELTRSVEEVSAEYQTLQNGIFTDAFSQSMNRTNKQKDRRFSQDLPDLYLWLKNAEFTSETSVKLIQSAQVVNDFETQCDDKLSDSRGTFLDGFIACRVTETVLNEFCAYEKFLWAKIRDDKTLLETVRERNAGSELLSEEQSSTDKILKNEFQHELDKSRRGVWDTLYLYQKFEQNYRVHAQLVVLQNQLIKAKQRFGKKYLPAFDLFPTKFIDAASKVPRQ